ncbi:hypothetical protein D3C75_917550 [compost metagenome]
MDQPPDTIEDLQGVIIEERTHSRNQDSIGLTRYPNQSAVLSLDLIRQLGTLKVQGQKREHRHLGLLKEVASLRCRLSPSIVDAKLDEIPKRYHNPKNHRSSS